MDMEGGSTYQLDYRTLDTQPSQHTGIQFGGKWGAEESRCIHMKLEASKSEQVWMI